MIEKDGKCCQGILVKGISSCALDGPKFKAIHKMYGKLFSFCHEQEERQQRMI